MTEPTARYDAIADAARREDLQALPTPSLIILGPVVDANIAHLIELVGTTARARPHIKTSRTPWAIDRLRAAGIRRVKAATHHEARLALEHGMADVLLA
ncbi:MAG: hypothetical protein WBA87_17400, partial [Microbacterium sp.]